MLSIKKIQKQINTTDTVNEAGGGGEAPRDKSKNIKCRNKICCSGVKQKRYHKAFPMCEYLERGSPFINFSEGNQAGKQGLHLALQVTGRTLTGDTLATIISILLCAFKIMVFKFVLERIRGHTDMKSNLLLFIEARKLWRIKEGRKKPIHLRSEPISPGANLTKKISHLLLRKSFPTTRR